MATVDEEEKWFKSLLTYQPHVRLADKNMREYQLWERVWKDRSVKLTDTMIENGEELEYMNESFIRPNGRLLIREEYKIALKAIELNFEVTPDGGAIVLGHPGIGKSVFLIYVLLSRLDKRMVTALQRTNDVFHIFSQNGVLMVDANFGGDDILYDHVPSGAWALCDSNQSAIEPARALLSSPFFIVQAASPRTKRFADWPKEHGDGALPLRHYMKPWTLAELMAGRCCQKRVRQPSDDQLAFFFERYGPSARDAYASGQLPDRYEEFVADAVRAMKPATLASVAQGETVMQDEGSHKVLMVLPSESKRTQYVIKVVTPYIMQLLWHADNATFKRELTRLYATFVRIPQSKGLAGQILETRMHELLLEGREWAIKPMVPKKPPGQKNTTFVPDPASLLSTVRYGTLAMCQFNKQDRVFAPQGNRFYKPISTSHPTIDSFIYAAEHKRLDVFQITVAETHNVNILGLEFLRDVARAADQSGQVKLRYIAVTHVHSKVNIPVPNAWVSELEMWSMEVPEEVIRS